ncbi:MAG: hypothetical protein JOZ62_11970 [Acidobacteriaceae bacterium]|nr:hypothetical protein [Acidobacteriaceae bacterium]
MSRNARENENFLGPFATRESAERYAEEVQGLFQIRRCAEALEPSPEHPGCIYGEMNQCLRPCQCVVTREEYGTEAARVAEFLGTNGRTMLRNLAAARDRASNDMHFEEAGQIHKRIEKVKAAAAAREREIAEIDKFSGVALTRSAFPHRFQLWPMYEGYWQDPVVLDVSNVQPRTKPLDIELRERLSESVAAPSRDGNRAEHLALFLRWYRSSWRDGDWFPFTTVADLNYRKLVREISTLDKAEGPS